MKFEIEIDLKPKEEELLIDKINEYCQDWFCKKPVLKVIESAQPVQAISAEEVAKRWDVYYTKEGETNNDVVKAMHEYASQFQQATSLNNSVEEDLVASRRNSSSDIGDAPLKDNNSNHQ